MSSAEPVSVLLIADVAGSVSLYAMLTEREAEYAVDRCVRRIARSVEAYDGSVTRTEGDELLASFANVDHAIQAAVDMQQRIASFPPISGLKLGIRVALEIMPGQPGETPADTTLASLIRMIGYAKAEQIICGPAVAARGMSQDNLHNSPSRLAFKPCADACGRLDLFQIAWSSLLSVAHELETPDFADETRGQRLRITQLDRVIVLDQGKTRMDVGRDPKCDLVISDRKASRVHAHIEQRPDGFYLVDTSTNGSFVTLGLRQELLVRHDEIRLEAQGIVCFGGSANDPVAERIHFEHF